MALCAVAGLGISGLIGYLSSEAAKKAIDHSKHQAQGILLDKVRDILQQNIKIKQFYRDDDVWTFEQIEKTPCLLKNYVFIYSNRDPLSEVEEQKLKNDLDTKYARYARFADLPGNALESVVAVVAVFSMVIGRLVATRL